MSATTVTPLTTPRGSSGATVRTFRSSVLKTGFEKRVVKRLLEQHHWLATHRDVTCIPRPMKANEHGYEMERLSELPRHIISAPKLLGEMAIVLGTELWVYPAEVEFNIMLHMNKLDKLVGHTMLHEFARVGELIDWDNLEEGLTHGDPTYDNVMLRHGQIVFIDPIPATPEIPDLLCVDRGKILTSVFGFEGIRYGDKTFMRGLTIDDLTACLFPNENERIAAYYWMAVHLVRAAPYMPEEAMKDGLLELATATLRGL